MINKKLKMILYRINYKIQMEYWIKNLIIFLDNDLVITILINYIKFILQLDDQLQYNSIYRTKR